MAPRASLAGRRRRRGLRALHQLAVADALLHVLRLLAIPRCRPRTRSRDRASGPCARPSRRACSGARGPGASVYSTFISWSAFSIFQQGCPPTFTHSFLQRCSVTAIVASSVSTTLRYACAGDRSRRLRPAAARGCRRTRTVARRAGVRALRLRRREARARGARHRARARGRRANRVRHTRGVDPPPPVRRVRTLSRRTRIDVRGVRCADDRTRRLRGARRTVRRSCDSRRDRRRDRDDGRTARVRAPRRRTRATRTRARRRQRLRRPAVRRSARTARR